ncbi:MAG TPA: hypothetical protein VM054_07310 [bacterium]|nr:hypothetical protein [bacterium]
MRVSPIFTVALLTAAALLAGCGGAGVLNTELDVSGEYSLVLADTDPAALVNVERDLSGSYDNVTTYADGATDTYPVELERTPGGWYDVTWRWTDDKGTEQSLTGVGAAFGESYFAVAEPVDGNPLYIFTVGSGALGGHLFFFGDTESTATSFTAGGKTAPEAPEVTPLDTSLTLNALGVDGSGGPYLAYYGLAPCGKSINLSQIINPGTESETTLIGTAAQVGDYLVMNTAGFLTIFQRAGEDWVGMWVDRSAGALASEILTPDDAKLDVMTFFVDNDFTLTEQEDGFYIARWETDGEPFEAPALVFGEKYLALSIPDPAEPWLGVFTVGEGAMGGRWVTWGSTTVLDVDIVSGGARPPDPPELGRLPRDGDFSCRGTNTEGETYEGTYQMQSKGDIVACRQTVTPTEGETEIYEGIGAVVDGYLVLATGPFLTVYSPSGDDWDGIWTDPYDKKLCDETLTYSE